MDTAIRIPRRTAMVVTLLALIVVALVLVLGVTTVARANEPRTVASAAEMKVQQNAGERDVERAYEQAAAQVAKVRALNLAISAAQADQITTKALADLRALRHSAFVSLGLAMGMTNADAETYAAGTEQRFEQNAAAKAPSASPVLLAPRFYSIVSRMSELATQLADNATNALTATPASPSSAPGSPTASARPSPTPSPTR